MNSLVSDCNPTGAITGRMSGMQLTLANPRNNQLNRLGTEIKAILQNVVDTDYRLCSFDVAQEELVIIAAYNSAEYCRFESIAPDALATEGARFVLLGNSKEGTDAHTKLAKRFGISRPDSKTLGLAMCLPNSSQAFSKQRGWVDGKTLVIGEEVLAYNKQTNLLEYTPVLETFYYKDQEVWAAENLNRTLLSTKDHRWVTSPRKDSQKGFDYNNIQMATTAYLQTARDKILHGALLSNSHSSLLTPNEARVLTWLLTDGSWCVTLDKRAPKFKSVRGYIVQGKALYKQQIYKLLQEENALSGTPQLVKSVNLPCYRYFIKSSYLKLLLEKCGQPLCSKKDFSFTPIIPQLNAKAIKACAYVIIKAEGTWHPNKTGALIAQNDTPYGEDIATVLYLAGFMVRRLKPSVNAYGSVVRNISAIKRKYSQSSYDKCYLHSVEDVWCIKTALDTFITRQKDGFITITGNCYGSGQVSSCNLLRPTLGLKYTEKELKALVAEYFRYFKGFKNRGDYLWQDGLFSHFFNYSQWLIAQPTPRLPFGGQAITNTLRPQICGTDFHTSRSNWGVQGTGSYILDCLGYGIDKGIYEQGLEDFIWYQFSCHDQLSYLSHESCVDDWACITRKAYKAVWVNFFKSFNMTCPQQVFDNLELTVDMVDRKAPDTNICTVSGQKFLASIPNGSSL